MPLRIEAELQKGHKGLSKVLSTTLKLNFSNFLFSFISALVGYKNSFSIKISEVLTHSNKYKSVFLFLLVLHIGTGILNSRNIDLISSINVFEELQISTRLKFGRALGIEILPLPSKYPLIQSLYYSLFSNIGNFKNIEFTVDFIGSIP